MRIPQQEIIDVFLSVADMCDDDKEKCPMHLRKAYNKLMRTKWAKEVYRDAIKSRTRSLP